MSLDLEHEVTHKKVSAIEDVGHNEEGKKHISLIETSKLISSINAAHFAHKYGENATYPIFGKRRDSPHIRDSGATGVGAPEPSFEKLKHTSEIHSLDDDNKDPDPSSYGSSAFI